MKKITTVVLSSLFCGLMLLPGCSDSSSDSPLGRVPAIFAEVAAERKALDKTLPRVDNYKQVQKALKEFDEYAARSYEEAAKEAEKIIGRDIVCTGDVYPDLKVTGAQVVDYNSGYQSGSFIVRVMVTPKRDIIVRANKYKCAEGEYSLRDTRLYFVLMTADDFLIDLGELNPFSRNTYLGSVQAEYGPGQMIQAGVPCHSEGAPLYINCHTFDFSKFAKIVFVREEDYMAIRKKVYDF